MSNRERIHSLDGFRAISVLLVLALHSTHTMRDEKLVPVAKQLFGYFGGLGVAVFFVMSGFLITTLLNREWDATGGLNLRSFYFKRACRILPPYVAYLVVMLLLAGGGWISVSWNEIATAAGFLWNQQAFLPWFRGTEEGAAYFGHVWSLCIEQHFYLAWPLILRGLGPRRACVFATSWVVLIPIVRVALYFLWPDYRGNAQAFIPPGGDLILLGCITALAREVPVLNSMVGWLASGRVAACAFVFLAVIQPWLSLLRGAYTLVVMPLAGGVAIVAVLSWALRSPGGRITGFLNHRWVVHLGVISYSVYIWQQVFLNCFNTTWTGVFPMALVVGLAAGEVSYWFIETPVLRWARGRRGGR